jgi:alpha-ketoglutarate-dependent taurine dioxygenase
MATMAARQKRQKSQIVVEKVGAALGAEISNVDLTQPVAAADMTAIQKAFVEHGLLMFRNQDLS